VKAARQPRAVFGSALRAKAAVAKQG